LDLKPYYPRLGIGTFLIPIAETNYNPSTNSEEGLAKQSETDRIRGKGRKEMVPEKYRDRDKTELTAVVEAGSNQIDFKLDL